MRSISSESATGRKLLPSLKLIPLTFFLLSLCSPGKTAEITPDQAKQVAHHFFTEKTNRSVTQESVHQIYTEQINDLNVMYIICYKTKGYILVSADDRITPVIGYSEEGIWNPDNHSPAFQNQLDYYKLQIHQAILNDIDPTATITRQWQDYFTGESLHPQPDGPESIGPLLSTTWGQGTLYNAACPADPSGPDGHALVGCVAVAMGQVLNYWSHPWYGDGSHSYTHDDYGLLSADFENTLYNYDTIPEFLSAYNDDVATLLYHCGVAVDMNYGPSGSGAWGWTEPDEVSDALKNYFYFHNGTDGKLRSSHPIIWDDLLKSDLDQGRPVIYGGKDLIEDNGHAWVVDGYNGDFYHMNWGWYGDDNGYYFLDNLAPPHVLPDDLNEYHHAIFGARPKVGILSGTITLAESPYILNYSREIPSGTVLTIEPGVEMVFRGRYALYVIGQIEALGSVSDTIVFTAENTDVGWAGIRLYGIPAPDSSRFRYCKFNHGLAYHKTTGTNSMGLWEGRNNGGAIHCRTAPAVSLTHCLITDNYAWAEGGGIYCEEGSDILIKNSHIRRNYAKTQGGGLCINGSSPKIQGCKIYQNENQTSGGAIFLDGSSLILENDSIYQNKSKYGGGLACRDGSSITMTNVHFASDSALYDGGGILCEFDSFLEIDNIHLANNNAGNEGGGIALYQSEMNMVNSSVIGNSSTDKYGGGILCGSSSEAYIQKTKICWNYADSAGGIYIKNNTTCMLDRVTLCRNNGFSHSDELIVQDGNLNAVNTIIWYSFSDDINVSGSSNVSFTYSNIKGGPGHSWFGTGCIDQDPLHTDPYYCDFTLQWDSYPEPTDRSPCIDAGDPSSDPDPDGTRADMGAFPYEQTYTPLSAGDVSGTLTCAGSPYYVMGDLEVPSGSELVIEPCVYLVFRGDYKLNVHGRLLAVGTEEDKIGFMPSDTVEGWQGIRFLNLNANGQDSSRLVHCRILYGNADGYNTDANGGGIYASQSSNLLVSDCYFAHNKAESKGGAIFLLNNTSPLILRCIFTKNKAYTGGAIACYDNIYAPIKNCQIFDNVAQCGGGIAIEACGPEFYGTSIHNNNATSFGGGLYHSGGQVPIFMETHPSNVYDNYAELAGLDFYTAANVYVPPVMEVFLDTASVAFMNEHLAFPNHLFDVHSNNVFFIQESTDLYVSPGGSDDNSGTSPEDPLRTINRALVKIIADQENPRTIHLASGTYSPSETGERLPINHRSWVTLSGEGQSSTHIEGDTLYRLLTSYSDRDNVVQYITLKKGYMDGSGGAVHIEEHSNPTFYEVILRDNYSEHNGGAVWCYQHCSPTFREVRFIENYSDYNGGGIFSQSNDTLRLYHVYFSMNEARHGGGGLESNYDAFCLLHDINFYLNEVFNGDGAGARIRSGTARLDSVDFNNNLSIGDGGGLFCYDMEMEIFNSTFHENEASGSGGGLYFYNSNEIRMENVLFNANSSYQGGAVWGYLWSTLDVYNGVFLNNIIVDYPYLQGDGGALALKDVETRLINVTLIGNESQEDGGGLYCWNNNCMVRNTIARGNIPDQLFGENGAVLDVEYSNVEGTFPGTGNIDQEPLFVNPSFGDFQLQETSPCINKGTPDTTGLSLPFFDMSGNPRISSDTIDMGAYEFFKGIILDLTLLLEGPFNGSSMNTTLAETGLIPAAHPYSSIPWSYTGVEEINPVLFPDAVDWILLEVRDTTDVSLALPESSLGRQAAILLKNGTVVDINGNPPRFGDPFKYEGYAIIFHKNHLPVLSASSLSLSGNSYVFDFTTDAGQAYGTDALKDLGDGVYGLFGGDADGNGEINALDKTELWMIQAGKTGYLTTDLNMDGQVDNQDKNEVWLKNLGKETQLPE